MPRALSRIMSIEDCTSSVIISPSRPGGFDLSAVDDDDVPLDHAGLETAIVLIAFVVVASVFAFAVLNTGLLSSEKSKEAALGGLQETS